MSLDFEDKLLKKVILGCHNEKCPDGYICVDKKCYQNGSPSNDPCGSSEQGGSCVNKDCKKGYDCFDGICCSVGACPPDQQVGSCFNEPCMIGYVCYAGICCPV